MVKGGATLVKYLLFFFNLLFVLTGLAVIIVGGVIQVRAKDYYDFLGSGFTSTAVLLIVVGVIIFLIAFFGCCGAIKENHCMVMTFSVLLFIVFIMEFSAGIAAYVYKSNLRDGIRNGMSDNLKEYNKSGNVQKSWNDMQKNLKCCGANNSTDYAGLGINLPESCCDNNTNATTCDVGEAYSKGCADTLFNDFNEYQVVIGGVGIGIAFVQVIGIVFACCLARAIKRNYEVV